MIVCVDWRAMQQGRVAIAGRIAILFTLAFRWGRAQPAPYPEFEVVELRPAKALPSGTEVSYSTNAAGRPVMVRFEPGAAIPHVTPVFSSDGRVVLEAATLSQLIAAAYPEVIREAYLAEAPRWADTDRFDLIAKAPPGAGIDAERRMIQGVLARRFHLRTHVENRPMPVYALVPGRNGSKLRPAEPSTPLDGCRPFGMGDKPIGGIHYSCHKMTMGQFAEWLPRRASGFVDLPVVDLTGLSGSFDFQLEWSPAGSGPDSLPGPDLFQALEAQLGLRLQQQKHPMPVVVIDTVDRIPSEN